MRKVILWLAVLLVLASFPTAMAAQQQSRDQQRPKGNESRGVRLAGAEDLIGSVVSGRDGRKLARVDSIVLDLHLGTVAYIVLRSGGFGDFGTARIAVPWDRFGVAASDRLTLNADWATLAKAPRFADDEWGRIGGDVAWNKEIFGYWGLSGLAGLIGGRPGGGLDLARADEVKGWQVIGKGGEDIAEVRRVILSLSDGTVATVLVAAAGPIDVSDVRIAIPYQKLTPTRDNTLVIDADPQKLARAPSLQEKGWGKVGVDAAWNRKVFSYWGAKYPSGGGSASGAAQPKPMEKKNRH